jgi:hypothetical protein
MYLSDFISRFVIVQRVAVVGCPIEKPGLKKSHQHDPALSAFYLGSNFRAEMDFCSQVLTICRRLILTLIFENRHVFCSKLKGFMQMIGYTNQLKVLWIWLRHS